MAVKAIVGANWGDEGKGKIIDYLASDADFVVRFQGGRNAGHTIINEYGKKCDAPAAIRSFLSRNNQHTWSGSGP